MMLNVTYRFIQTKVKIVKNMFNKKIIISFNRVPDVLAHFQP